MKVALFNVSMSGDSSEGVTAEIHVNDRVDSTGAGEQHYLINTDHRFL